MIFGPYRADVRRPPHDGDTIYVDILLAKVGKVHTPLDLGFNIWRTPRGVELLNQSVRLYGSNAPELNTQAGKDALAFIETLVHVGDVITVISHGWDKFAPRIDGEVKLADGRDLVATMIAAGHALPWGGKGPKPV